METVVREESTGKNIRTPHRWWRRGTVWILLLAGLLWSGDAAVSLLVQHSGLRAKLTARLVAAFGRPVQVGDYAFSIWGGPMLEAQSVRIGEDPRFGNEYFLRADSISVGLRWLSLLRGHIELGTLSLNRPSLNLVRAADGDWNLAEWLPKPAPATRTRERSPTDRPMSGTPGLQFHKIEISDGRINFKRGYDKLAFAFVDLNGTVQTDSPGRWRMDLRATPWRAAVITQQPGVIHVTGHVGGTSSRLRPAALDISWTDASISDFFRLLRGDDYGIRGSLAVSMSAHTEPHNPVNGWVLKGKATISGIHRWDLAARADNPSFNLVAKEALLDPKLSELRLVDARIEALHSSASARAELSWNGGRSVGTRAIPAFDFVDVTASHVSLSDVLDWVRAFHAGVPDSTSVRGVVDARAHLSGWPLNLIDGSVRSGGADLFAAGLHGPARIGPIEFHYSRGAISLRPITLSWGPLAGRATSSFRIDVSPIRRLAMFPSWRVVGRATDMRDLAVTAAAMGLNFPDVRNIKGPFSCDLRWDGSLFPWKTQPVGTILLGGLEAKSGGASLRLPFLNQPVERIRARMELRPGVRRIDLKAAKAFDANWSGTFERRSADAEWHFALAADRLSAADLDRWLDPRWRESFIDRMLPFLGSQSPAASPEDLLASGKLDLGEFALERLVVRHLQGNLNIDGRHIEFSDARGEFYGGAMSGILRADLAATPNYHAKIAVSRMNAYALAKAAPKLLGLSAASAEGQISIDAKGSTRPDLLASLTCRGAVHVTALELAGFNPEELQSSSATPKKARIPAASAAFTCARRTIKFQRLSLGLRGERVLNGSGSVGFNRSLDLRFQDMPAHSHARPGRAFRLTGNLSSPRIVRLVPARRGR